MNECIKKRLEVKTSERQKDVVDGMGACKKMDIDIFNTTNCYVV